MDYISKLDQESPFFTEPQTATSSDSSRPSLNSHQSINSSNYDDKNDDEYTDDNST